MSAPLVVNTRDGVCWTRRTVTPGGIALYAPESVQTCPDFVMATLLELAEHGIAGSADVLPVPVGTAALTAEQRATIAGLIGDAKPATGRLLEQLAESVRDRREHEHPKWEDLFCLNLVSWAGERMGPVLRRLLDAEARVAELEVKYAVDTGDLALECGQLKARLAEFERPADEDPIRYTLTEQAPVTIFRAEHPDSGITLGHYGTAAAARAHCEATERRSWPTGTSLTFDWIEDEDDGVAELVVTAGQNEESTTGYIVTALEVPSEYDEEADA